MVSLKDVEGLLQNSSAVPSAPLDRAASSYKPLDSFRLQKDRSYQQQYGDMYFLRLAKIKPAVEQIASAAWEGTVIGGEPAKRVDRVLDVRQGELCWVAGTVYMELPLKPSIMDDVAKDRWVSGPTSVSKYYSDTDQDQVFLEDDSGRIRLMGALIKSVHLVTGCIIAVMGTENANGHLEVIDIKFPDLAPQPQRWALTKGAKTGAKKEVKDEDEEMSDGPVSSKIAIVSGLSFSGSDASYGMELNLLMEFLLGEALDPTSQQDVSRISRLIIAGNSVSTEDKHVDEDDAAKKHKKYGYDASAYNAVPSQQLDEFLADVLPTIPVTLLPGVQDPANASYPQQAIHTAMFPLARKYAFTATSTEAGWFDTVTNPWEGEVDGWRLLGTGGQNVDDLFRYVDSDDRLGMMEAMCRWRCSAPTAPDTLWSYPFQEDDPFVMKDCPHVYFVGSQPSFSTKVIYGPEGQVVRLITIPSFSETKELVLVDTETLEVSTIRISIA